MCYNYPRIGGSIMTLFKYIYLGLISPYILIKKYFSKSIQDVNVYKYKALTNDNKKESDYLCINEKIVNNFFITENKKLISIKTNKFIKYRYRYLNHKELSKKELVYFLVQINSFISAGNSIINSLSLIIKKCKYKNLERILRMVRYDLMCGNDLGTALSMQGSSFPKLMINVLKDKSISEENHLIELEDYYKTLYFNDLNYSKIWLYRLMIIPYILMVTMFIIGYVIPKFYNLYKKFLEEELTFLKGFLKFKRYSNLFFIIFIVLIIILFIIFFLNCFKKIKEKFEYILMKLFYKTVTNKQMVIYSKTMSFIIKYNITDKDVLHNITDNIYYDRLLNKSFDLYKEKQQLTSALNNAVFFPKKDYDMIKTGEKFDSLLLQINNLGNYHQKEFDTIEKRNMKIIGPLIIIFSTCLFGSVLLILLFQCLMILI